MLISLTAFMGLKPAASYFKRDFCTAYLRQKVPKNLNYQAIKRAPARSIQPCGSKFSLKLQENQDYCPINMKNAGSVW